MGWALKRCSISYFKAFKLIENFNQHLWPKKVLHFKNYKTACIDFCSFAFLHCLHVGIFACLACVSALAFLHCLHVCGFFVKIIGMFCVVAFFYVFAFVACLACFAFSMFLHVRHLCIYVCFATCLTFAACSNFF